VDEGYEGLEKTSCVGVGESRDEHMKVVQGELVYLKVPCDSDNHSSTSKRPRLPSRSSSASSNERFSAPMLIGPAPFTAALNELSP